MKKGYLIIGLFLVFILSQPPLPAQDSWERVATLVSDVSRDESAIIVKLLQPIQEGQLILLESRDGSYQEVVEVRHMYGHNLILESTLLNDFVSGSRIYQ